MRVGGLSHRHYQMYLRAPTTNAPTARIDSVAWCEISLRMLTTSLRETA